MQYHYVLTVSQNYGESPEGNPISRSDTYTGTHCVPSGWTEEQILPAIFADRVGIRLEDAHEHSIPFYRLVPNKL